ncbi:hypothetical protein CWE09_10755 [Aliidiomarina minuta]|uniref:DUF998 domain-containing protein n=1 Tax=Aliidiomarina minuta TaxID=880057 RepID=A0A432W4L9_9GAMM|nr:hypothetical protein [Aliidiomarina minuta]RUO24347.1 hypothetical protein CWE09_10755 [Aliidiomarina minuta]
MRPQHIAWMIFLIPVIAVHGAYAIGWWEGVAFQCNPYIDGCTTISRAAREGNAIFFFRALMMPLAALLVIFWYLQQKWLERMTQKSQLHVFILGSIGALFLILYVDFLGTEGDFNRFLRRYGVIFYFGLTVLAQIFSINTLHKLGDKIDSTMRRYIYIQLTLIILCWLLGMGNLLFKEIGFSWADMMENNIEWHFALYMWLHFPFVALMWKRTQFAWQFSHRN